MKFLAKAILWIMKRRLAPARAGLHMSGLTGIRPTAGLAEKKPQAAFFATGGFLV